MNADAPYHPPRAGDLLRLPVIGRLLRWRWGRLALQAPLLLIAALLIYDGFTGVDEPARNLATLVPWVHYRGLVIVALLLVGNLFCMACPFTIPRTLAKRFSLNTRAFPRWLRNKWVALITLFALFFLYEWLDMWSSPALTAWVIVAYFVGAFTLEAFFSGSPFCKYVCPLGTFNFAYSTFSPTKIGVHDPQVCRTCVGKECLNGSYSPQPVILIDQIDVNGAPIRQHTHDQRGTPGCGTALFAPQIKSNMDCILCLDCARACPHENVGWFVRAPAAELTQPDAHFQRWDHAFLLIALAFMGLVNAFGMVPPVYDLMQNMARALGLTALGWRDHVIEGVVLLIIFVVGSVIIPALLTVGAALLTRALTRTHTPLRAVAAAFAPAFVPVGFGFWAAHYGFHFLIGVWSIIPTLQFFLNDHGVRVFGAPNWSLTGIQDLTVIGALQTLALLGGFAGSLLVAQRIAIKRYGQRKAISALLAWALVFLLMMLAGWWLIQQPMEMRGSVLFD